MTRPVQESEGERGMKRAVEKSAGNEHVFIPATGRRSSQVPVKPIPQFTTCSIPTSLGYVRFTTADLFPHRPRLNNVDGFRTPDRGHLMTRQTVCRRHLVAVCSWHSTSTVCIGRRGIVRFWRLA